MRKEDFHVAGLFYRADTFGLTDEGATRDCLSDCWFDTSGFLLYGSRKLFISITEASSKEQRARGVGQACP
jgi:hypothetical protein